LEIFIGKALKRAAVLGYRKLLITLPMGISGSPEGENFLAVFEGCRGNKPSPSSITLNSVQPEDIRIFFGVCQKIFMKCSGLGKKDLGVRHGVDEKLFE
jgi:hypothetical protein